MSLFKIGDIIEVLDDNMKGKIVGFEKNKTIKVETSDGFELVFNENEVILVESNAVELNFNANLKQILAEKEGGKKKQSNLIKLSKKEVPVYEVDLHLEKIITGRNQNLSNYDKLNIQLEEAKRCLDFAISKRYQRVVLIHGVGEGILRNEIHDILKLKIEVKSFINQFHPLYGYGATEIFFK